MVLKSSKNNPFQCLTIVIFLHICFESLFVLHLWSLVIPPCSTFMNLALSSWWPSWCRYWQNAVMSSWRHFFSSSYKTRSLITLSKSKCSIPPYLWPITELMPIYQFICVLWGLKLDAVFQLWSNYSWFEGNNIFPPSPDSVPALATWNTAVFCCQGMLLAHI